MSDQKALEYLCIYDPQFNSYASDFCESFGLNATAEPVSCMDDLRAVVNKYALVRYVEICLHGGPGMIYFANKGAMMGSYLGILTTTANTLCREARVLFLSCNIGGGPAGDKFLTDLGQSMFKGIGGTAGASTVTNLATAGGRMNPLSAGRLKVRRFDTNGDIVGTRDVDQFGGVH